MPEGIAVDKEGNVFVSIAPLGQLWRIPHGSNQPEIFGMVGDPLDWPSSVAFGTTGGEQKTLFAVNFSIGENFGDPMMRSGPGVVTVSIGIPGQPLP